MKTPNAHIALEVLRPLARDLEQIQRAIERKGQALADYGELSASLKEQALQRARHYLQRWSPHPPLFLASELDRLDEKSGGTPHRFSPARLFWLLDPLDNPEGVIRQNPSLSLRLTLVREGGLIEASFIHTTHPESWLCAEREHGLQRNHRRLRFTPPNSPRWPEGLVLGLGGSRATFHTGLKAWLQVEGRLPPQLSLEMRLNHTPVADLESLLAQRWDGALWVTQETWEAKLLKFWLEAGHGQLIPMTQTASASRLDTSQIWACQTRLPWFGQLKDAL